MPASAAPHFRRSAQLFSSYAASLPTPTSRIEVNPLPFSAHPSAAGDALSAVHPGDAPAAPFSPAFYAPYAAAAQVALSALCRARRSLVEETGEDVRALTYRLKTPDSIRGKLLSRGLPVTDDAARAALHDIAGLRAVLSSVPQVYRFAALLRDAPSLCILSERDYIAAPKRSGYRSLHIVAQVAVPGAAQGGAERLVPVEIQLRTAPMDIWASIEHQMVYKPLTPPL